jgi:hypothetical protein
MRNRMIPGPAVAAAAIVLFAAMSPPAGAQSGFQPCPARQYPGLTFGPNVPSYAAGMIDGQCYCGAWTNISPGQAMRMGWYASCESGRGTCNFKPGTRASNAVCKAQ